MSANRLFAVAATALLASGAAAALGACGSSGDDRPSAEQVAAIKREAIREERAKQRTAQAERELKQLRREIQKLKKRGGARPAPSSGGSSGGGSSSGGSSSGGSSSCGGGVSVNSVTSCPFAANVVAAFHANGPGTVYASSPVTGQTYAMSCSGGVPTVCTGGNGAAVYIR
ncbi:hypothetical protein [Conexibacter arvalis]|uniref:Secreted protein n=1 Tax=Conexibacter arvalis TaxID=912552 RepID=A0A840IAZ3_9ACTN|nr:hypothetical protein [Conexibacter arvalis]MBB4661284.1 hypothetical protein [Conexibacter arvalis]